MPRKGFGSKQTPRKPRQPTAYIVHKIEDGVLTLGLECTHGEWFIRDEEFTSEVNPDEDKAILERVTSIAVQLILVHDNLGHPAQCVRKLRPPEMPEPVNIGMEPNIGEIIFIIHTPDQTIVVQKRTEPFTQYYIQMLCNHGASELLIPEGSIPWLQDGEDISGSRYLWEQINDGISRHHKEYTCTCLVIPPFDLFYRMSENGIVGIQSIPVIFADRSSPSVN